MKIEEIRNKVISGIYKINYPNGKAYIGQAQNIYARLLEHNQRARKVDSKKILQLCDEKIREYNCYISDFDLLEIVDDITKLDEREKYWIKYYKTYKEDGGGYNLTRGGDASGKKGIDHYKAAFNEQSLNEVIDLLINHTELSLLDIANKYNVDQNTILRISTGRTYTNPNLQYPLRKNNHESTRKDDILDYFKSEEDLISFKEDIKYRWDLPLETDLSYKWGVPKRITNLINNGNLFAEYGDFEYPIRKKNIRNNCNFSIEDVKNILSDLRNTNLTKIDIGKKYNISRTTVTKINNGESYIIKDYEYPARK